MNIRLVKGAYWDTEIKIAQEQGLIKLSSIYKKIYYRFIIFKMCTYTPKI